ncbi:MAG: hypothetical protein P4L53_08920 [Candidatus Obscuribacterales bacterium]|nr:hypothetical protein [Candidatus Obscuribacterales bacterium]
MYHILAITADLIEAVFTICLGILVAQLLVRHCAQWCQYCRAAIWSLYGCSACIPLLILVCFFAPSSGPDSETLIQFSVKGIIFFASMALWFLTRSETLARAAEERTLRRE